MRTVRDYNKLTNILTPIAFACKTKIKQARTVEPAHKHCISMAGSQPKHQLPRQPAHQTSQTL